MFGREEMEYIVHLESHFWNITLAIWIFVNFPIKTHHFFLENLNESLLDLRKFSLRFS